MKAGAINLLEFLQRVRQLVVPIYQRPYCWSTNKCRRLWDDVVRTARVSAGGSHFVGSVVYVEDRLPTAGRPSARLMIDGQQRLSSLMLMIEAVAAELVCHPVPGRDSAKMRHLYLKDAMENGDDAYKLLLSKGDRPALVSVVDDTSRRPASESGRFENHGRKESARVSSYTVEHILPQNPNLNAEWRIALGIGWEASAQRCSHRLGNLTLSGSNPELSDRWFVEKRDMVGGYGDSPLRLNDGLRAFETRDEAAVDAQSAALAAKVIDVWAPPSCPKTLWLGSEIGIRRCCGASSTIPRWRMAGCRPCQEAV